MNAKTLIRYVLLKLLLVVLSILTAAACAAEPKVIKIATVAPKGSIFHRVLQDMGEATRLAMAPGARVIVYPDSIQGSEADVVRRMRVGQLDASLLTIVGLHDIDPAVGALQYMPMMFRSWDEVDYVREALRPMLEEKLAAKGFVVLAWGEAGWVQFFSRDRITLPDEYRKGKIFTWAGDRQQAGLMKSLGFNPVGIQLTDIAPSLETGMVDIVPMAPIWALVGQFDRVTHYMLPINWVPIVGAIVMRSQTYDALSPAAREALRAASRRAGEQLRANRSVQDQEVIRALQARGMTVLEMTPQADRAWRALSEKAWTLIRGSMVPAETFDRAQAALAAYRAGK